MPGGPGGFARSFTSSVLLWSASHRRPVDFVYGPFTLCGTTFLKTSTIDGFVTPQSVLNPRANPGLGCSDFARRYSRNKCLSLFLWVLRCFSSPRSPLTAYAFSRRYLPVTAGEFPHSEISGSTLVCQLPEAYRRLPRLSSPLDAKASTIHP